MAPFCDRRARNGKCGRTRPGAAMSRPEEVAPAILRRIAVAAAGLDRQAPFGRGHPGARRALAHLGYVQIDTISVVRRAHEHVLLSRVPGLGTDQPDALVRRREAFEYWAHAAAYLPIEDFRFALPRMARLRAGGQHWVGRDARVMAAVLERVRAEGPLRTRDFETPDGQRSGWWSWKPAKIALDRLFHEGELMVVHREGFEKTYDLTERALPAGIDTRMPTTEELATHLVARATASLGVFTARHVTHLRREPGLRPAVAGALEAAEAEGRLVRVRSAGRLWHVDAQRLARAPRVTRLVRFLSPFDPMVIHRDRLEALFGFDYQLECYLPAAKRRHGYFSLPILHGAELIGRADCKADRTRGRFLIRNLALEPDADPDACAEGLARAASRLAVQDGCDALRVERLSGLPAPGARALAGRMQTAFRDAVEGSPQG